MVFFSKISVLFLVSAFAILADAQTNNLIHIKLVAGSNGLEDSKPGTAVLILKGSGISHPIQLPSVSLKPDLFYTFFARIPFTLDRVDSVDFKWASSDSNEVVKVQRIDLIPKYLEEPVFHDLLTQSYSTGKEFLLQSGVWTNLPKNSKFVEPLAWNARPLVQANLPAAQANLPATNLLGNSLTNTASGRPLVQTNLPTVQASLPSTNLLSGSQNGQAKARPLVQANLPANNLLGNLANGLTGGRPLSQINLAESLNGGRPLVTANIPSLSVPNINRLLG